MQVGQLLPGPRHNGGVFSFSWLPMTCLHGDTLMKGRRRVRGSGRGKEGLLRAWPRTPLSCPVPRVEASPASTSAIVVEAETASQASEPASQASDEEDTPATDIYFVSPPGALSRHGALNPHVLMRAHLLTCPHTWTHIAHTIIPLYTCLYTCTCVHVFTSTPSRICTRSH